MLYQTFVTQPGNGIDYLRLFREAFDRGSLTRIDAAIAYATRNGVRAIDEACLAYNETAWKRMKKRWLVGIDYCRTEPIALEMLGRLPNSKVRIHAGKQVVSRKLCTPILPYHPKTYILYGRRTIGTICGSGNLSGNGLTKGHEIGSLMITTNPTTEAEKLVADICEHVSSWFRETWRSAATVPAIFQQYEKVYEASEHLRAPSPTDDDCSDTKSTEHEYGGRRALSPDDLRRLRACKRMWIEAGNLHHNRGKKADGSWKPGNQLMLTPLTRVFFGFRANDLDRDSAVGHVAITFDRTTRPDCSLRFSNNAMDVLTLPVPGNGGPASYDKKNLLFQKQPDGTILLTIGTLEEKSRWIEASRAIEGYHQMTGSGRQWGVF